MNMLCAGPLARGQQGAEEERGRGGALTARRHPNPITDCCHSTAGGKDGQTAVREGVEGWNRMGKRPREKEKKGGRHTDTSVQREREKRERNYSERHVFTWRREHQQQTHKVDRVSHTHHAQAVWINRGQCLTPATLSRLSMSRVQTRDSTRN